MWTIQRMDEMDDGDEERLPGRADDDSGYVGK